jgi:hypothetical protein
VILYIIARLFVLLADPVLALPLRDQHTCIRREQSAASNTSCLFEPWQLMYWPDQPACTGPSSRRDRADKPNRGARNVPGQTLACLERGTRHRHRGSCIIKCFSAVKSTLGRSLSRIPGIIHQLLIFVRSKVEAHPWLSVKCGTKDKGD